MASCQLWSLALAGAARAVTLRPPVDPGHVRALTPDEMRHISGAQRPGALHTTSVAPDSGGTYPWEASVGGANTGNGNKTTTLPLVGWTARGGLPVSFTLAHNSQGNHNAELGHKWTFSYDLYLAPATNQTGDSGEAVHWGDDRADFYLQNGSSYTSPTGIHDALVQNVDGTWTVTRPDQTKYHFNSAGYCDTITDENGNALAIAHNAGHYVTSVTDANGRAVTLGYDASSRIHTVTDPLGRVWTLTYDGSNDLAQVAFPAVGGTSYSVYYGYNAAYDITSVTDLRGNSRSLSYNSDGSLATEADNAGSVTTFGYTSSATTVTDANGHATVYTYASGRLSQVTDPAGYSEYYAYDSSNDRTQVQDKRGHYWNYTYNSAGDQLTATDPLSHTTTSTFNSHNRLLTKALPGGEGVANTYDTNDNLTQVQEKNASGTTLATTTYTVGSYGLVSAKQDADSHTTSYGYDGYGNLANVTTPLGNETQWGHDALGTVTSRTDAMGRTTGYTLDAWERTTTETYPDTSTKTFSYDADSNLTGFADATGTTGRAYDADNRLISEGKGGTTVVSHTYDAAGQKGLLSTTTDSGGRVITYAYTNRNQLYSVSEAAGTTSYAYDDAGEQTGITNANGTTVTDVYDNAGRLTGVTNKSGAGTTLSSFAYGYNSDDLKASCTEASGDVVSYGYDGQLHLTSESRTGAYAYSNTFAVDGVGNRTGQTVGGVTTTFTYDNDDELLSTSGGFTNSYGYNADGDQVSRTLSGTAYALSYDYDDQYTGDGGFSYAYDAAGRRVSVTNGSVTTAFQYDGGAVLLEKQGSSTAATYTYGNSLLRKDGETPLFDGLGSERTVTNSSGAVQGSLTLSAFGGAVASSGSSTSAYQFGATSGYRSDGDAGLVKVGCRYYDPQVGRFTTRDTCLDQKAYVYCDGDPVDFLDPDGHYRIVGLPGGPVTLPQPTNPQFPAKPVSGPVPPGVSQPPTGPGTVGTGPISLPGNGTGAGSIGKDGSGGIIATWPIGKGPVTGVIGGDLQGGPGETTGGIGVIIIIRL